MRETVRDRAILRLVYEYRILSQEQLRRLLHKSRSTVQQILIRLYHHRYLERVFLPVSDFGSNPTLYILDSRGREVLQREGIENFSHQPNKDVSMMFLEHTLAINDVRIAITEFCGRVGWALDTWKTDSDLKADYDRVYVRDHRGKPKDVSLIPDGYFMVTIPERGTARFFLELDRGTMTLERFRLKVEAYIAYYRTQGFEQRYNAKGFRVLTIVDTPSTTRLENLLSGTAQVPQIGRRFWFCHFTSITSNNVFDASIWSVAGGDPPKDFFGS